MKGNRDLWLALTRKFEGGYVDHPEDKGGPTNMGITQAALASWRKKPVTEDDVKALTWEEASAIYQAKYWNVVKADQLPSGLDVAVADFAVNSGPRRAAQFFQRVVGAEDDGYIGPDTLAAANACAPGETLEAYLAARATFLRGQPNWDTFGAGWTNRLNDLHGACLMITSATPPAVKVAQAKAKTSIVATVTAAGSGLAAAVPAIVAVMPAAKATYQQTLDALGPMAQLAPWMQYAVMVIAAGSAVAVVWLALKNHKLLKEKTA